MSVITIGDKVKASFKSGEYIGEVVELSERKAAVKVLAVVKHPLQGDLHHEGSAHVTLFHQRRALSYQEIALMPLPTIVLYNGFIADYQESLRLALDRETARLQEQLDYAERSLGELRKLRIDYFSGSDSKEQGVNPE